MAFKHFGAKFWCQSYGASFADYFPQRCSMLVLTTIRGNWLIQSRGLVLCFSRWSNRYRFNLTLCISASLSEPILRLDWSSACCWTCRVALHFLETFAWSSSKLLNFYSSCFYLLTVFLEPSDKIKLQISQSRIAFALLCWAIPQWNGIEKVKNFVTWQLGCMALLQKRRERSCAILSVLPEPRKVLPTRIKSGTHTLRTEVDQGHNHLTQKPLWTADRSEITLS